MGRPGSATRSWSGGSGAPAPRLRIEVYEPRHRAEWDALVRRSRNGVFLFHRDYLEYHADRFADHSLLFFQGDKLLGVMPASIQGEVLSSHGGLTFGGVVSDERLRTAAMLELFGALKGHLRERGIRTVVYKAVPHIYHRMPAEEDLYALSRHGGKLTRRDVSSAIQMSRRAEPTKGRKWGLRKARAGGLDVQECGDFRAFMSIEEEQLRKKYGVRPTHTAAELEMLAGRFPDNIRLFTASRGGRLLGGVVVYRSERVAHAQYIAATDEGRELGCLDVLVDRLLSETYADVPYFDFGISTEDGGRHLNLGLIDNKESYGARAVCYDFYEWDLN
jgi:hypothetical protein